MIDNEKYIEESMQVSPNKEIWEWIHADLKNKIEKQNLEIIYDNKYEKQLEEIKSKCYANLENIDLGYSFWDKLYFVIEFLKISGSIIANIVIKFILIYLGIKKMNSNLTSTITGIVAFIGILAKAIFGFEVSTVIQGLFVALVFGIITLTTDWNLLLSNTSNLKALLITIIGSIFMLLNEIFKFSLQVSWVEFIAGFIILIVGIFAGKTEPQPITK